MNQKQLAIYNLLKTLKTVEEAKAVNASKPVEETEPLDCWTFSITEYLTEELP